MREKDVNLNFNNWLETARYVTMEQRYIKPHNVSN